MFSNWAVLDGSRLQAKDPLLSIAGAVRGLEPLIVFIMKSSSVILLN